MGEGTVGGRGGKVERAVRGATPETPDELLYQREAVEHYLVGDGYDLDDLRGYEFEFTTTEPARGLAALLGGVGCRLARIAAGGAVTLGLLGTAETGLLSPVAVSLAAAAILFAIGELDDPGPVTKSHKVRRPGMTEREVYRRLTMSNHIQELKNEEREKARRKAERQSNRRNF